MAILIQNDVTEIDGYKQQPTTMWFCKNAADMATIPSTVSPGSKAMYKKDQNGGRRRAAIRGNERKRQTFRKRRRCRPARNRKVPIQIFHRRKNIYRIL